MLTLEINFSVSPFMPTSLSKAGRRPLLFLPPDFLRVQRVLCRGYDWVGPDVLYSQRFALYSGEVGFDDFRYIIVYLSFIL